MPFVIASTTEFIDQVHPIGTANQFAVLVAGKGVVRVETEVGSIIVGHSGPEILYRAGRDLTIRTRKRANAVRSGQ